MSQSVGIDLRRNTLQNDDMLTRKLLICAMQQKQGGMPRHRGMRAPCLGLPIASYAMFSGVIRCPSNQYLEDRA